MAEEEMCNGKTLNRLNALEHGDLVTDQRISRLEVRMGEHKIQLDDVRRRLEKLEGERMSMNPLDVLELPAVGHLHQGPRYPGQCEDDLEMMEDFNRLSERNQSLERQHQALMTLCRQILGFVEKPL